MSDYMNFQADRAPWKGWSRRYKSNNEIRDMYAKRIYSEWRSNDRTLKFLTSRNDGPYGSTSTGAVLIEFCPGGRKIKFKYLNGTISNALSRYSPTTVSVTKNKIVGIVEQESLSHNGGRIVVKIPDHEEVQMEFLLRDRAYQDTRPPIFVRVVWDSSVDFLRKVLEVELSHVPLQDDGWIQATVEDD